ncbi:MAG: lactonase family protein [Marinilabiliaceae bacterium]|nr:lactonase family protein [Marinilabiliaceae bacterium]
MKKLNALVFFGILLFVSACRVSQPIDNTVRFYIGTYTSSGSEGIYMARFDTLTGMVSADTLLARLPNPSYLNLSADGQWLMAVSESGGVAPNVFSYRVQPNGELVLADTLRYNGQGACYVSEYAAGAWVVSNYGSGSVTFFKTDSLGKFLPDVKMLQHVGSGPNTDRQQQPHAHSAMVDPAGRYVYVADLGTDRMMVYNPHGDTVRCVAQIATAPGSGPRHFAFHPSSKVMATLNELHQTVDVWMPDSTGVYADLCHTVLLLPDTLRDGGTAADIHFSPDGRFLYASNRGTHAVVAFAVDANSFELTPVQHYLEGISRPRNFVIDPSGRFLLVANQDGDNIVVLQRDLHTGLLSPTGHQLEVKSPVCLKFD